MYGCTVTDWELEKAVRDAKTEAVKPLVEVLETIAAALLGKTAADARLQLETVKKIAKAAISQVAK